MQSVSARAPSERVTSEFIKLFLERWRKRTPKEKVAVHRYQAAIDLTRAATANIKTDSADM